MPAEGMVHALRRTSELLEPDGVLIDLHPTPDHAQLTVIHANGREETIGPLVSDDARERHANAEAAIATAIAEGTLTRDAGRTFVFSRYADSLDELVAHVHAKWTARFDDEMVGRARRALHPGSTLRLWEHVSIGAFHPGNRTTAR